MGARLAVIYSINNMVLAFHVKVSRLLEGCCRALNTITAHLSVSRPQQGEFAGIEMTASFAVHVH